MDAFGIAPLLSVFDMPQSVHFYRDVLGFEIITQSQPGDHFHFALLRLHGADLMLNTAYDDGQRPPAPDATRIAAHEDMCLYFGCQDLDAAYEHLRAHEVKARPPKVAPYGMRQLYFKDPDGYNLCFQFPVSDETREQWRKWYGLA
jgi:catechol 2,3-dioxygenase-like lactoylglutathione lyase family enzyme